MGEGSERVRRGPGTVERGNVVEIRRDEPCNGRLCNGRLVTGACNLCLLPGGCGPGTGAGLVHLQVSRTPYSGT